LEIYLLDKDLDLLTRFDIWSFWLKKALTNLYNLS
jgi:hypothetical protein